MQYLSELHLKYNRQLDKQEANEHQHSKKDIKVRINDEKPIKSRRDAEDKRNDLLE